MLQKKIGRLHQAAQHDTHAGPCPHTGRPFPMTDENIPTLLEWCGGLSSIQRLTASFYEKVSQDVLLAPVFQGMHPHHAEHVAAFVAEVLGNDEPYTLSGGSHAGMIGKHVGRCLTEFQRRRWIAVMLDAADEIGLPDDPEFRAAFVGYLEWGTRLAVVNSQNGAAPPSEGTPMPTWGWSSPGGPYQP